MTIIMDDAGIACLIIAFFLNSITRNEILTIISLGITLIGIALIIAALLKPAKFQLHIIGRKPLLINGN